MKTGDRLSCPHCQENTVVKTGVEMDGWTRKGDVYLCALCGGKLGDVTSPANAKAASGGRAEALAGFLGVEKETGFELTLDDADRRFCRDCRFFIIHPFASHCDRHPECTDPMADCRDFTPRTEKSCGAGEI